jgi:serine/threonine protein kinase
MRMLKDELHKELLRSEINSLTELKGTRHVLRLIEVFTTANNTYIVTELCEGKDLGHQIQTHKGLKYFVYDNLVRNRRLISFGSWSLDFLTFARKASFIAT